tara:strand:+ start:580 stop:996 length:417 start_codon:yes stop_codon:yes gene_type:complete
VGTIITTCLELFVSRSQEFTRPSDGFGLFFSWRIANRGDCLLYNVSGSTNLLAGYIARGEVSDSLCGVECVMECHNRLACRKFLLRLAYGRHDPCQPSGNSLRNLMTVETILESCESCFRASHGSYHSFGTECGNYSV